MTSAAARMMEKWGWSQGQGLGKDNRGMTSPLFLRKNDGSTSQGRIEMSTPMPMAVKEEPDTAIVPLGQAFDIDPRDPSLAAAAAERAQMLLEQQQAQAAANAAANEANSLPTLAPPKKRQRIRQWVVDDWRWSRGMEATFWFEEVQLPKQLLELAKKILGEESRYPARVTDATDCVVEVTAWNTLLVRPRGTGAKMELAKRMLYEVLHPHNEDMREDAIISPEEMEEMARAHLDNMVKLEGDDEITMKMQEGLARGKHGNLNRVGIGAEFEVMLEEEMPTEDKNKAYVEEMEVLTTEDVKLVHAHLDDLRVATGVVPVLKGMTIKFSGKEKQVRKAMQLTRTLVETGEWVALTEGFIASAETKEKKRGEGPSEQILIKVPEGPVVDKIEKHLKAMERASAADQLKLTSKAVSGKRTLMVEGTKAVHERVKLMVKELAEKGESPMLQKELGVARAGRQVGLVPTGPLPSVALIAAAAAHPLIEPAQTGGVMKPAHSVSSTMSPGVISAPARLKPGTGESTQIAKEVEATKPAPGAGMRLLPGPKLAVDMAAGKHLFSNLPAPGSEVKKEEIKQETPDMPCFATVVDVEDLRASDPVVSAPIDGAPADVPMDLTPTEQAPVVKTPQTEEERLRDVMAAMAEAPAFPPQPPSNMAAGGPAPQAAPSADEPIIE